MELKDYKPENILCNADYNDARKAVAPYIVAFFETIRGGMYKVEGGIGYGFNYEREIKFAFDVSEALEVNIEGETIKELYWKIQKDGAHCVPVDRHEKITKWLLNNKEYLIDRDILIDYNCEI